MTAIGNDHINIEGTISKTLAKLYTKCLPERRVPRAWKNAKMVIIFEKGDKKDNYICALPRRRVRKGYTISPKLFTAALESIFRRGTWLTRGLKIDGEYLNHLRLAHTPHELQQMVQKY